MTQLLPINLETGNEGVPATGQMALSASHQARLDTPDQARPDR